MDLMAHCVWTSSQNTPHSNRASRMSVHRYSTIMRWRTSGRVAQSWTSPCFKLLHSAPGIPEGGSRRRSWMPKKAKYFWAGSKSRGRSWGIPAPIIVHSIWVYFGYAKTRIAKVVKRGPIWLKVASCVIRGYSTTWSVRIHGTVSLLYSGETLYYPKPILSSEDLVNILYFLYS